MINGFEEETKPLTPAEFKLVPNFISNLEKHVGIDNAVTNKTIRAKYKQYGYKLTDTTVRKIIHHIRVHRLLKNLVASNKGYYIEKDPGKVVEYVSSLQRRIQVMKVIVDSFDL